MIKVCCNHVSIALAFAHMWFLCDSKRQEETLRKISECLRIMKYIYHWFAKVSSTYVVISTNDLCTLQKWCILTSKENRRISFVNFARETIKTHLYHQLVNCNEFREMQEKFVKPYKYAVEVTLLSSISGMYLILQVQYLHFDKFHIFKRYYFL